MSKNNFKSIYDEYCQLVYNVCLNYLQNTEDAEDVTQEVFVKIHRKLDTFNQQSSLKTWVYRIAINACLDYLKAQKNKKSVFFSISIMNNINVLPVISDFNHPGVLLENKEALKTLFEKINTLPVNQKTAIILKSIEKLSQKEIAETMNLSTKAVESLLSRARKNLKEKLNTTKEK